MPAFPTRWRSMLYAPAIRPELAAKLPRSEPDVAVVDLEGTVADNAKEVARSHLTGILGRLGSVLPTFVRVNRADTAWFAADVAAAVQAGAHGIFVPRVQRLSEIEDARSLLEKAGAPTLPLGIGLETALGILDARPLLAHPGVHVAYLGAEDLIADLGGVRTPSNHEVAYARSHLALCARVGGVVAIDQIVADFHDDAAFDRECREARALGYAGKACVHPRQVPHTHRVFRPTPDEIAEARQILEVFDHAQTRGLASVAVDGRFVDQPVADRARRILALASRTDASDTE